MPLSLREQRVQRREELCTQHEEELARLAKEMEQQRQQQQSELADWEKFKAELEAVQAALDARQRELEGVEYALAARDQELVHQQRSFATRESALAAKEQNLAAQEKDLAERSEKLAGVVQRLKQREESINTRETQLRSSAPMASRDTAVKRETEVSKSGAKPPMKGPEPLPAGSSLSLAKSLSRPAEFRDDQRIAGPPTAAFQPNDDSEPSVTEQFAGMGIASPEMSVLMADQVMLRAAAKGSSIPGEHEDVFSQPEESIAALSISRVIMD